MRPSIAAARARWPRALVRWSQAAAPREACGLLLGASAGGDLTVRAAVLARNQAEAQGAFALDPGDFVRVHDEALARGLAVVGVWHSHVDGPPRPSPADCAAAWPGFVQVIVGPLREGVAVAVTAWRIERGAARRLSAMLVPA